MKFVGRLVNKLIDMVENYNRYKMAVIFSKREKDGKRLKEKLDELYDIKPVK